MQDTAELPQLGRSRSGRSSISWSVIISLVGVVLGWGISWGTYSQRLQSLEASARHNAEEQRDADKRIATHDTQIAVIQAQLAVIQSQLATIITKLEQQERQRP